MKILYINTLYYPTIVGGAEKVVQSLAEGLASVNVETVVAATASRTTVDQIGGVKVYHVGMKNLFWTYDERKRLPFMKPFWHLIDIYNPFMAREVEKIIDREQPDLVHTHNLQGFSVAAWKVVKKRGLPLVHTMHDYYLFCPRNTMFGNGRNCTESCWTCSLFSRPKKPLSALVDHVVSPSKFVLDRHVGAHYFAGARSSVIIYNASVWQGPARSSSRENVAFGFLGRLQPEKGIESLLQVFAEIEPGAATLEVAGTGKEDYVDFLRRKYARPNIRFLGFVPPRELFDQIDVLIVPSLWHDTCPLVVLEALSFGTPVIAARRGGIPEEVEDGKTGFLFEPSQPEELRRELDKFIQNPMLAADMASHCWSRAKELTLSQYLEKHLGVYRGLLE
jgi:glycosyltransferase involved in cell wall biosynthesis